MTKVILRVGRAADKLRPLLNTSFRHGTHESGTAVTRASLFSFRRSILQSPGLALWPGCGRIWGRKAPNWNGDRGGLLTSSCCRTGVALLFNSPGSSVLWGRAARPGVGAPRGNLRSAFSWKPVFSVSQPLAPRSFIPFGRLHT